MKFPLSLLVLVGGLAGCAQTPTGDYYYILGQARNMSSAELCAAIESGHLYKSVYNDALAERNEGCSSSAVAADSSVTASVAETNLDERAKAYDEKSQELVAKARSGEISRVEMFSSIRDSYFEIFPEDVGNVYMNEYFSYALVLAEKVDLKKMSGIEADYELSKKWTELVEREEMNARQQSAEISAARAQQAAQMDAATAQQAAQAYVAEQERKRKFFDLGMQILQWNHEQGLANQLRPQNCLWIRTHNGGYIQQCQ